MSLTDLFNSNAWQCHSTTPGSRRAAGVLKAGATGELTGRHAPTRQGGPGEQGACSGQEYSRAAPSNCLPRENDLSQSLGWGPSPSLPPSIVHHCLVPTPPHSKSTTSDNIPAQGPHHFSWPPGHPCPVCKSRGKGSSSRALFASPTSRTPVCLSTSHR